ncbi:Lrp/AsnC family transcriptional regulator [Candidatus Woesearchaeota archaeon]|nr:Lrp/AsnC family transcriptional regulator [Candidatus Woesearchaeota archaeon]
MDKFDTKILQNLLNDSRISNSKLGKKIRLSRENVSYRIKKLTETQIIKEFVAGINYTKLGWTQSVVFVQYKKITTETEKELIQFLKKQNCISWIGILTGKWSLTFDVYHNSNEKLNQTIKNILSRHKELIGEYLVLEKIDSEFYFEKIIDEKNIFLTELDKKKNETDKIDKIILKELNKNPRISYVELAKKTTLTPNGAKQRYKRLVNEQIIINNSISVNHKILGYEWQGIQIKIKDHQKNIEKKLKEYFRHSRKIIFFYQYNKSGIYDFDIGVIVKTSSELREFINKLRTDFYSDVEIIDTFLVLDEASSHKLPNCIFN